MKRLLVFASVLAFMTITSYSNDINIIPTPKIIKEGDGKMYKITSIKHKLNVDPRGNSSEDVGKNARESTNEEYYTLSIKKGKVIITGNKLYGLETLRQLKDSNGFIKDTYIEDWPTFKMRGFMHDVGRNFQSLEMIKKDLLFIASYKLNVFHFHLTDNPAWRIESFCHPELNDPKFQRKGRDEGKFYTYSEIRELIAFAKNLGITIIPEIDMPGHSKYFTTTFGFTMDSPLGRKVLEELIEEFCKEISKEDCPYIHIGSDEIHIEDKEGFMRWAESTVRQYGRETVAWDPGLPSDNSTIRQIWNEAAGDNAAASEKPGRFLDSYMGYLNYYDPIGFIDRVFMHKTPEGNKDAMGGILCLWNDVRVSDKQKICPHSGMETGVMVFSERMWNGGGYDGNSDITPSPETNAGKTLAEFEKKMAYHRDNLIIGRDIRWAANSKIPWRITVEDHPTIKAWGGAVNMDMLIKENSIEVLGKAKSRAETEIYASSDTVIQALVGFEAAARSNRISGGIGPQGKFENEGRIFVNGIELFPSKAWEEPGKYHFEFNTWHQPQEELPYTDEQFYWMRTPVSIKLNKGWNEIKLFNPKTFKGQRWSFAFIPVTLDEYGKITEVKNISFR